MYKRKALSSLKGLDIKINFENKICFAAKLSLNPWMIQKASHVNNFHVGSFLNFYTKSYCMVLVAVIKQTDHVISG